MRAASGIGEDVMSGRASSWQAMVSVENFHRSVRAPPASRRHAGHIIPNYDTAGHSLTSRLCRVPAFRRDGAESVGFAYAHAQRAAFLGGEPDQRAEFRAGDSVKEEPDGELGAFAGPAQVSGGLRGLRALGCLPFAEAAAGERGPGGAPVAAGGGTGYQ